jgi:hypothetical protein
MKGLHQIRGKGPYPDYEWITQTSIQEEYKTANLIDIWWHDGIGYGLIKVKLYEPRERELVLKTALPGYEKNIEKDDRDWYKGRVRDTARYENQFFYDFWTSQTMGFIYDRKLNLSEVHYDGTPELTTEEINETPFAHDCEWDGHEFVDHFCTYCEEEEEE